MAASNARIFTAPSATRPCRWSRRSSATRATPGKRLETAKPSCAAPRLAPRPRSRRASPPTSASSSAKLEAQALGARGARLLPQGHRARPGGLPGLRRLRARLPLLVSGEAAVTHYHGMREGFVGRRPIPTESELASHSKRRERDRVLSGFLAGEDPSYTGAVRPRATRSSRRSRSCRPRQASTSCSTPRRR